MSYSTKKSAQSAARKQYGANYAHHADIKLVGEKWEIVPKVDYAKSETTEPVIGDTASSQVLADEIGSEDPTDAEIEESNKGPQNPGDSENPMDSIVCPECGSTELYTGRNVNGIVRDEDKVIGCHQCDWEYEVPKPSMLTSLFGNMSGAVPVPPAPVEKKAETKSTGLTIEKDRPEQNGVKRPSAGGMCRAVWDACWAQQAETGEVPTAKWVKEKAAAMGWNPNNASIEYYQWRKFNGISGRVAAPKPAAEPAAEAATVETPADSTAQNAEIGE